MSKMLTWLWQITDVLVESDYEQDAYLAMADYICIS